MSNPKNLVIIGGILLMVGAVMPWAVLSSAFLGVSRSIYGYETDGLLTGLAGFIVLVIGFATKTKPGKQFSFLATLIVVLLGVLILWKIVNIVILQPADGIRMSLGLGLSCVSPLGIIFAYIGGAKTPKETTL